MTAEKRTSTVSFTKAESQILNEKDHPSDINDDENVHISLDPIVQTYLANVSRESGCWGKFLTIPFERASSKSWWDPTFDSEILEEQFRKSASTHNKLKFRCGLWYILLLLLFWFIYFLLNGLKFGIYHWPVLCSAFGTAMVLMVMVLLSTFTEFYDLFTSTVSSSVALALCITSIIFVILLPARFEPYTEKSSASPLGYFSICTEILLLIYTIIPLRFFICITVSVLYSVAFELLTWFFHKQQYEISSVFVIVLSHMCIHLIGCHILIMTNVRTRNTFMKVGQSLLVRKQLESEKKLKDNMILSLMPPAVAQLLFVDLFKKNLAEPRNSNPETNDLQTHDIQSIFRPFIMSRMEQVSILFADIVGFTKMSSSKTAEEVVEILNSLFQRFDLLCKFHNCEKISTLGDCYYCVSGCPDPRPDHAKCCVEMGLSMIQAIKQFDQEQNEGINMRVGVHTGSVLCGIVGTKRFKFDVWSKDVTLANSMESAGKPGMVHISEKTLEFLPNTYLLEDGKQVSGLKTYFILGKKYDRPPSYNGSFKGIDKFQNNSLQLIVSPPTSPPSMSPLNRPRVLSCDTTALKPLNNPNQLSPDVCKIKASSLPSILDSENEQEIDTERESADGSEQVKTPTSTASSGRYSVKIKSWKIPKFLKKSEQKDSDIVVNNVQNNLNCAEAVPNYSGYQQVPTIIESQTVNCISGSNHEGSWSNINQCDDEKTVIYLDETKDSIDVKSYISQSRSDVGQFEYSPNDLSHFIRTGSYRSQCGRAPNEYSFLSRAGSNRSRRGKSPNFDIIPAERSRSATVTISPLERPKKSLEVPSSFPVTYLDDQLSTGRSVNSRKDSGIRSNSRKSSIQQIDNPFHTQDNHQHRVSGYFTSSQSTINSSPYPPGYSQPIFGRHIQNLRKQSDRQLIKCVQANSKSERPCFMKPPLAPISLFFKYPQIEQKYRTNFHMQSKDSEYVPTLANSKFNTCLDVFISTTIFFIVSACLFVQVDKPSNLWLGVFTVCILLQVCAIALCFCKRVFLFCNHWYRWNIFGGILVSMPLIAVLVNYSCIPLTTPHTTNYLYIYLIYVGIVHFCNFTQLNSWMKNLIVSLLGIVFICLILTLYCPHFEQIITNNSSSISDYNSSNISDLTIFESAVNVRESHQLLKFLYDSEILLDIILLLILVWILNREFETGYRASFHAHYVAYCDKINIQYLKNQADWLIYNIVPEHVADQLKKNAKYSENFKNVGIIFASIVNFNEFYDESYLGGKEFMRVLNELISDFDELLMLPQFECVEKIKTIGSTFMAASGLNTNLRDKRNPNEHLYVLMDFAIAMQKVIDNFNKDLLEFNLILRIGYNFGDVTAAVIGKTKLYFDIWGDAVNIASRMDTTGVHGKVQVGEHCLSILENRYVFEKRGTVYVKGKDNMNVYFLVKKKDDD